MFETMMLTGFIGVALLQLLPTTGQNQKNIGEDTPAGRQRRDGAKQSTSNRQHPARRQRRATAQRRPSRRLAGDEPCRGRSVQADWDSLWDR